MDSSWQTARTARIDASLERVRADGSTGLRGVVAIAVLVAATGLAACGGDDGRQATAGVSAQRGEAEEVVLTPESVGPQAARRAREGAGKGGGTAVELRGAGAEPRYEGSASSADAISPGAPSDDEVRAELRQARAELSKFKRFLGTTAYLQTGPRARVLPDGTAVAPDDAPEPVKRVIQAANAIAKLPYKWGGGHGAWRDNGYDCSGSVSFALAGAGLLQSPLTSGGFMSWGAAGPGEWITIYANQGHIFMIVAGLRFDTSGQGRAGTRWQDAPRPSAGFAVRSVPGL
jgi:cell wall-associated NlpC family hydrolase